MKSYSLPVVALGMLAFAVIHAIHAYHTLPRLPPIAPPPQSPLDCAIAGSGIVEAQSENIAIGSYLPGVVAEVFVAIGQQVTSGAPLFRLDDRQLRAELEVREADLAVAEGQLKQQLDLPRSEELPVCEARVREAEALLAAQEDRLRRVQALYTKRVASEEEFIQHRLTCRTAREQLARARSEYALLRAGAPEADRAVTRAAVARAHAQVHQTRTELDRLLVRAPVDGGILQVNVRPGEYVGTPPGRPLILLGNVDALHVRVDIDEHDIPRFQPRAPAYAAIRGDSIQLYRLDFLRVEPYIVPKRSLTGAGTEHVDTRVLQVSYALDRGETSIYVGQQLDVFIAAGPVGRGAAGAGTGAALDPFPSPEGRPPRR